jgi:excisionase family DNA binding protein
MTKINLKLIETILANDSTVSSQQREMFLAVLSGKQAPVLPELFTQSEAAKYYRCSRQTIYQLCKKGFLSPITLPTGSRRFRKSDLDRVLEGQ